jgi:5-methyltetrahydropteroyltriglutamate--homocysteine methyltransferase
MPDYAEDLITIITKDLSRPTRLHVCGDVSNIISKIVEIPVDILSHEFKASPELFKSFKDISFPQEICLGSVRSDHPKVETIDEITVHIQNGINVFDDKICQLSPDCGLRNLPRDIAFKKLKNLVKAGEKIYG